MGYNSWYDLMCSPYMNETTLHATADAMVEKGLVKLGYNYLNLDDCYITSRDASGVLQPDPKTFSSGMKSLGDYAHSKGMKFVSAAGWLSSPPRSLTNSRYAGRAHRPRDEDVRRAPRC